MITAQDGDWQSVSDLHSAFRAACASFGPSPQLMADIWDDILTQHQAPGRHYHNVRHLCSMSSWLRAHQANFPCPATVFSVLWHDYVYDPTSTENEAKSAEAADEQLAQLNVDSNTRERVVSNIRATVKHEPEGDVPDPEQLLFLDADLSILGTEEPEYRHYTWGIRREYSHLSDNQFIEGRTAVLRRLLDRPSLYYSRPSFTFGLEHRARANLMRELRELADMLASVGQESEGEEGDE